MYMFKVNNKDIRTTPMVSLLLTLNIFHTLWNIVNFEHVNAVWEHCFKPKPKKVKLNWFSDISGKEE